MLTNWCLSESTRDALAEIEQAMWEHAHTMQCVHAVTCRVSDEQWAQRTLNDEGNFNVAFDSENQHCQFTPDAVFNAVDKAPVLMFRVRGFAVVVESDGTVTAGCQVHPVADFLPGGKAEEVAYQIREVPAVDRQALVEAVQARLAERNKVAA